MHKKFLFICATFCLTFYLQYVILYMQSRVIDNIKKRGNKNDYSQT